MNKHKAILQVLAETVILFIVILTLYLLISGRLHNYLVSMIYEGGHTDTGIPGMPRPIVCISPSQMILNNALFNATATLGMFILIAFIISIIIDIIEIIKIIKPTHNLNEIDSLIIKRHVICSRNNKIKVYSSVIVLGITYILLLINKAPVILIYLSTGLVICTIIMIFMIKLLIKLIKLIKENASNNR